MNKIAEVLEATGVPRELWPPEAFEEDAEKAYKVCKALNNDIKFTPLSDSVKPHVLDKMMNFATNYGGGHSEYLWAKDKLQPTKSLTEQGWGLFSTNGLSIPFETVTVFKSVSDIGYHITYNGIADGEVVGGVQFPLNGVVKEYAVPATTPFGGKFTFTVATSMLTDF